MKRIVHSRNAKDQVLHIETDGAIVNITVGLTDADGNPVTRIDISPDDETRSPDPEGYYWYRDDARVIRLPKGQRRPEVEATIQEPQQPGTHRDTVEITWSEVVTYRQEIEIDVPDGYTGDITQLIDVDDRPADLLGDDAKDFPADYRTHWLDRMDPTDVEGLYERDILDVVVVESSE